MNAATLSPLFALGLFIGMLVLLESGRRIGLRRVRQESDGAFKGIGTIEGAVFGLLGLLIAFTFSGAASRFDERRQLVTVEANNISTAWLRIDALPADAQPMMRDLFRQYLDSRLETFRRLPDIAAAKEELAHSVKLQGEIWSHAIVALREPGAERATMLVLPALNQMIDITTTRIMATERHPPMIIFFMLALLAFAGALLAGYATAGSKTRNWLHSAAFAAVVSITVYIIIDIEYPRLGLIRVDAADEVLVELRKSMN